MLTIHIKWLLIKACTVHFCFSRLLSLSTEWKPSPIFLLTYKNCFNPQASYADSRCCMIYLPLSLCCSSVKSLWHRQTLHPDRNTLRNPGVLIPVLHSEKAECKSQSNAPAARHTMLLLMWQIFFCPKAFLINGLRLPITKPFILQEIGGIHRRLQEQTHFCSSVWKWLVVVVVGDDKEKK